MSASVGAVPFSFAPPVPIPSVGKSLCERTEKVLKIARLFNIMVQQARTNGSNYASAGTNIAAGSTMGIIGLMKGNFQAAASGAAMTAVGAFSILQLIKSGKDPELVELLQNAQAGISMIQVLEEANNKSFQVVDVNLEGVRTGLESLNASMEKIQNLAIDGNSRLKTLNRKAEGLSQESEALYREAEKLFHNGQKEIGVADRSFVHTLEGLEKIQQLAKDESASLEDRLAEFVKVSEELHRTCCVGKETLEKANGYIAKGLEKMRLAHAKHVEAATIIGEAIGEAHASYVQIAANARKDEICQEKINAVETELHAVKGRNKAKTKILENVEEQLAEAEKKAESGWGVLSVFGAMAGAVASTPAAAAVAIPAAVIGGPVGLAVGAAAMAAPFVVGAASGQAVHKRVSIIQRLRNLFLGPAKPKTSLDFIPINLKMTDRVRIAFDDRTSGVKFWKEGPSSTVGDIEIDLGFEEPVHYRFKLGKDQAFSNVILHRLQQNLLEALDTGALSKEECQKVLQVLTSSKVKGQVLVPADSPYLIEVKNSL